MKKGFTLAEALITLAIIGVVAALAAPALNSAVQKSKIGPSLAKFKSTTENGLQRMMAEKNIDSITSLEGLKKDYETSSATHNTDILYENLQPYFKISARGKGTQYKTYHANGKDEINVMALMASGVQAFIQLILELPGFSTPDGMVCWFSINPVDEENTSKYVNNNPTAGSVVVDINGETKPNKIGKDLYAFNIMEDGTLVPFGSTHDFCKDENTHISCKSYEYNWKNGKNGVCNSSDVTASSDAILGLNCTASVLENSQKVIYKY